MVASDPDSDQALSYSLNSTFGGLFSVTVDGRVVLEGVLDREIAPNFVLHVVGTKM